MMIIFLIGIMITKTNKNLFTVIAALFTLVIAQYGVQFFSIINFKDGNEAIATALRNLPEDFIVWNSALLGDQIGMTVINHIIITDKDVICLYDEASKNSKKNIDTMKRIANNKGLEEKVKFIKIEENNLDEYIEKWSNHQIKNHNVQEEMLNYLKSSAIE